MISISISGCYWIRKHQRSNASYVDKERSSKLILSATNMVLAEIFSYQYSILTSDKEGQYQRPKRHV